MNVKLVSNTSSNIEGIDNAEEIIVYCARVSNPKNQLNKESSPKLLSFLIKHGHWSPFELASMCLEIKTSRGIAAQILRHRSFSFQEFSQRYSEAQELEPHLADLGMYSDPMLRGFIGKMSKHVIKISCVIHAIDNYKDGITNSLVKKGSVIKAYDIFSELTKLYVNAADEKGFSGENAQLKSAKEYLQRSLSKGHVIIRVSQLLDNIKKAKPWSRQDKITSHFRANIMPKMSKMYWCDYDPIKGINYIRINPKL